MKKLFVVMAAAILLGSSPSTATAQPVAVPLCVNGVNVKTLLEFKGAVGTDYLFDLSGYIPHITKDIVIDGTVLVKSSNASLRFGITLHNAIGGSLPVTWEFVTNLSLAGSGTSQVLVGTELSGPLSVMYGVCPAAAVVDSEALGIVDRRIE